MLNWCQLFHVRLWVAQSTWGLFGQKKTLSRTSPSKPRIPIGLWWHVGLLWWWSVQPSLNILNSSSTTKGRAPCDVDRWCSSVMQCFHRLIHLTFLWVLPALGKVGSFSMEHPHYCRYHGWNPLSLKLVAWFPCQDPHLMSPKSYISIAPQVPPFLGSKALNPPPILEGPNPSKVLGSWRNLEKC